METVISNEDLIQNLEQLRKLALRYYPLPENGKLDLKLCFALGQIAGTASKAIEEYRREQKSVTTFE